MQIKDIQDEDNPVIYKGRIYPVPEAHQVPLTMKYCLVVNREFYNAAGRPPINTVDDIIALAEFGVNNGYFNRRTKQCFTTDEYSLIGLICQEMGYIDLDFGFGLKDGNVVPLEETEVFDKLFEIVSRLDEKETLFLNYTLFTFESRAKMSLVDSRYISPGLINALKVSLKYGSSLYQRYRPLHQKENRRPLRYL
jgi:hypothetical protein